MWKKKARRKGEESKKNRKGQGRGSIKKTSAQKILEVEKSIQEKGAREDASTKGLGPCHRTERRVLTKEGKKKKVKKVKKDKDEETLKRLVFKRFWK